MLASSAAGDTIYNNLTPNNSIGMASRPDTTAFEIETGDDFLLQGEALITSAAFDGLLVPGIGGTPSISQVVVEIYRVFPNDSDTTRTPAVPTRNNSPSDNAFASKDSSLGELNFTSAQLAASFTTVNSVQPGGIHLNTLGNGPLTGSEVEINVTFSTPFDLQPDHYFFVPQVELSNGGVFYWLSASRPITGFGTTPFLPDLQVWTRDASLDPDWLRVGTDIVGGMPAPTFNAAFALEGTPVPEPSSILLLISVLALFGIYRYRAARG
jgi:hypothetical protein